MAEDVLAFTLYRLERSGNPIPAPSDAKLLTVEKDELITLIRCDTMVYRKKKNNKAVKKTLTIPEWLNEEAISRGVNFSQVLQDALIESIQESKSKYGGQKREPNPNQMPKPTKQSKQQPK